MDPAITALAVGFMASNVFLLPLDPIPLVVYPYGYWKFSDVMKIGFIITLVWIAVATVIISLYASAGILVGVPLR